MSVSVAGRRSAKLTRDMLGCFSRKSITERDSSSKSDCIGQAKRVPRIRAQTLRGTVVLYM
eukprot:356074-Prymnesium_polylepis.1